jgi:hypothetical protein
VVVRLAGGFGFVKASSRFSSSATRFSSGSRLRTRLLSSSTLAKSELAAPTTFEPPGRSAMNFWSASSPLSASRWRTSFCCFFFFRWARAGEDIDG